MATTKTRRCIGSARFGIEPHDAPLKDFPTAAQPEGRPRAHVRRALARVRQGPQRRAQGEAGRGRAARGPQRDDTPEYATADEVATAKSTRRQAAKTAKATTKRERRRTPMASQPVPASPKVRKARETLAATEMLGRHRVHRRPSARDEVQAALETVNGHGHAGEPSDGLTPEQAEAIEAIATELDPRTEDEIRALEGERGETEAACRNDRRSSGPGRRVRGPSSSRVARRLYPGSSPDSGRTKWGMRAGRRDARRTSTISGRYLGPSPGIPTRRRP